jgi:hypothetical protein
MKVVLFCIQAAGRSPKAIALLLCGMTHYPFEALEYVATGRSIVQWKAHEQYVNAWDMVRLAHNMMKALFNEHEIEVLQKLWVTCEDIDNWLKSNSFWTASRRILANMYSREHMILNVSHYICACLCLLVFVCSCGLATSGFMSG